MDEILGFLLATKNTNDWFTTKSYVDEVAIQGVVTDITSAKFSITDGELIVEDISQEIVSQKFLILEGFLVYDATA